MIFSSYNIKLLELEAHSMNETNKTLFSFVCRLILFLVTDETFVGIFGAVNCKLY